MYLLVFATLIISMVGVYAQVMAVEAARIAAQQSSIAQAMMGWQTAAVSMGANIVDTNYTNQTTANLVSYSTMPGDPVTSGCSLTAGVTKPPPCPSPLYSPLGGLGVNPFTDPNARYVNNVNLNPSMDKLGLVSSATNAPGLLTTCSGVVGSPPDYTCDEWKNYEPVHLPAGYALGQYQFYSVMYYDNVTKVNYVVTFVPPPVVSKTNPDGFLTLANGKQIGVTSGGLLQQLRAAGIPAYTYGTVQAAKLTTLAQTQDPTTGQMLTASFPYPIPSYNGTQIVPDGSIALIGATNAY